ncbi:STY4851/ECs_5259 family protein [Vibrio cholerae]|uniref:STY4851/ECs_5259 family protein n=1 Tax=Vibrio cholerae TaxID=666 RepID=UPI001A2E307B|nr:hypothetical protein [Vibrio cholerae]
MTNPSTEIHSWFIEFEKRRPIHKLGMPLWSLKVTDEELNHLQIILKGIFSGKDPSVIFNHYSCTGGNSRFDQVFTLYLATWIQRNFRGGRERWPVVLASLNIKHENRLNPAIYESVKFGLKYWGIDLYSTSSANQYFATLYCQGGFPRSGLVGLVDGPVSSYLDSVITQFGLFHKTSSLSSIAEKRLEVLPETLKQIPFATLASALISSLLSLRDRFHLYAEIDPVAALSVKNPGWRDELPFLLCDEEAHELMGRLLKRAATIIRREQNPVRIRRYLTDSIDCCEVVAETHINYTIHPEDLNNVLGVSNLPTYFDLYTQTQSGERARSASFNLKGQQNQRWQVLTKHTCFYGADATSAIGYELWSDGRLVGSDQYYRGEELNNDLPWVFSAEGQRFLFVGQGNVSAKQGSVFVVFDGELRPSNALSEVEKVAEIASLNKSVFKVTGRAEALVTFGKFTISTFADEVNEFSCWFDGKRCSEAVSHRNTFYGRPNVFVRYGLDKPYAVPEGELFWRCIDSDSLCSLMAENLQFGLGVIVWIKDGNVKWQSKCALLPESAHFNVLHYDRGEVELKATGFKNTDLGILDGETKWLRDVDKLEDIYFAELQLPANMPESFHLILGWNNSLDNKIVFEFASMQAGICLLTPEGTPYKLQKNTLTVEELFTHKLKVKMPSSSDNTLSISAALMGKNKRIRASVTERIVCEASTTTISSNILGRMAQVLYAQSDNLYDFVTFKFYAGQELLDSRLPKVEIFKHPVQCREQDERIVLKVLSSRRHKNRDTIVLSAAPIWDLGCTHYKLERTTNSFDDLLFLMPETDLSGPWFVYALNDNKVQPRTVVVEADSVKEVKASLTPLQRAVRDLPFNRETFQFDYTDMDACIEAPMESLQHADWCTMQSFVDMLDLSTPNTFHLFRRLILKTDVLATLLLQQQSPESFERLWSLANEMPFEWLYVPVPYWEKAIQLVLKDTLGQLAHLQGTITQEQFDCIKRSVVESRFQMLADKGKYFKTVVELVLEKHFQITAPWSTSPIFSNGESDTNSILYEFHQEKAAFFSRHDGRLMNHVQNKHNDRELRDHMETSMSRSLLPAELKGLLQHYSVDKNKADARAFALDLPVMVSFKNAGLFDNSTTTENEDWLVSFALSQLQKFDRVWIQNSMSCALKAAHIQKTNTVQ